MPGFYPYNSTLLEGILRDSAYEFLDDINTPEKETLKQDVTSGIQKSGCCLQKTGSGRQTDLGKIKGNPY